MKLVREYVTDLRCPTCDVPVLAQLTVTLDNSDLELADDSYDPDTGQVLVNTVGHVTSCKLLHTCNPEEDRP